MANKHQSQRQLALKIGITPEHLNAVLRGRRTASRQLAAKLEQFTGVGRLAWLYPDEFENPYLRQAAVERAESAPAPEACTS